MGETVPHYKGHGSILHKMGSGIYSRIDLTVTVSRGKDPDAFGGIKINLLEV
jgi:cyanate lyase